jgi:hypothetical protein
MRHALILLGSIAFLSIGASAVYAQERQAPVDPYSTEQHTGVVTPRADQGRSAATAGTALSDRGVSAQGPEDQRTSPVDKKMTTAP